MFTGIVQEVGRMVEREKRDGDHRMGFTFGRIDPAALRIGDSICVQGCCLTVVELQDETFRADVSRETLRLTTLGQLALGAHVNLEPALKAGDALGGHLLSGHVDGLGQVVEIAEEARSWRMDIALAEDELARYVARKGSVAVDGVSLTVNLVRDATFRVNLIPHTREVTTLGRLQPNDFVNIEIDLIARYVERLLATGRDGT
ncbi:MAG: riboflavin synthase [Pseudomonadota bacterium]|nr:riboflavin synthase [Pseudomonadota bacterium]